jgi:uncharacterized protein (DUF2062 family)
MARKYIKRFLPDVDSIRANKQLKIFGTLLHDANLWHLNRHSVSTAFAVGLFMAFMPMPFQMLPAALLSIFLRGNLPISVALVWITNPVTMPPIYYFCYKVGTWVLGVPPKNVEFAITWEWLSTTLMSIWQPFLLGCLIVSAASALIGYLAMRAFWRWQVVRDWQRRKSFRKSRKHAESD